VRFCTKPDVPLERVREGEMLNFVIGCRFTMLKKGDKLSTIVPKPHPTIEFSEPTPPSRDAVDYSY
jgi:hypothetical protein